MPAIVAITRTVAVMNGLMKSARIAGNASLRRRAVWDDMVSIVCSTSRCDGHVEALAALFENPVSLGPGGA